MQVDVILTLGHILFGTAIGIIVTNHPQNFQAYPVLPVEPVKLAKFWCDLYTGNNYTARNMARQNECCPRAHHYVNLHLNI